MDEETSGGLEPQLEHGDNERTPPCQSTAVESIDGPFTRTKSGFGTNDTNFDSALNGAISSSEPNGANAGSTLNDANAGFAPNTAKSGSEAIDANTGSGSNGTNTESSPNGANTESGPMGANLGSVATDANTGSGPNGANTGSGPKGVNAGSGSNGANTESSPNGANTESGTMSANLGSEATDTNTGSGPNGANSGSVATNANTGSGPKGDNSGSEATNANTGSGSNGANSRSKVKGTKSGSGATDANTGSGPKGDNSGSEATNANTGSGSNGANSRSEVKGNKSGSGATDPITGPGAHGPALTTPSVPSGVYKPPSLRARQQKRNGATAGSEDVEKPIPTVPTFEQYMLQQVKEMKIKGPFVRENAHQKTFRMVPERNALNNGARSNRRTDGTSSNHSYNHNVYPKHRQNTYVRHMSCSVLANIAQSEAVVIIEKISRQKESFKNFLETAPDERDRDIFALVFELITKVWKSSFEESKKLLLLEICNSKFIDHLQLYLMQIPYTEDRDKRFNKHYWTKETEFWRNFMTFCECVIDVSPSTAVRKCGSLIEAISKSCLDILKEKHEFELPVDYATRMTSLRENLKKQVQNQSKSKKGAMDEPLESFRELSVLPTGSELLERRPFLRPNVVEGAYSDVDHYLDVQFRLLREDCFGPLREGIRKFCQLSVLPTGLELLKRRPFLRPNVVEGAYSDVEHYLDVQFRLLREDCFGPLREGIRKFCQLSVLPTGLELLKRRPFLRPNVVEGAYSDVEHYLDVQFRLLREDCFGPLREGIRMFCQLSVLLTGLELLKWGPFLRPNVVEGAYSDVEHYLDVQFRLLREDCFGPLREGIHQYIEDPRKRKYDHIRLYHNVKFLEPYFTRQKFGSLIMLDKYTDKMFKKVNWKQSKRFLFGSLVLFTKDNCKSFLVGTILERDEELLTRRLLGVSIIDSTMESDLYNDDLYTMIECEVYFEPYHHVLKALQAPSFPEHLAMNKYIVHVQKVPENPAYLTPHTVYALETKDGKDELEFSVLQDKTWPSEVELGLDSTQYEAYKLALTHEFAVIQGPPGTGKTFLGVKVAKTLLENAPFSSNTCCMLVICYTNHALDQFLEALLPITDSIVRIGGRSQSQLLEKHNISNLRGRSCYDERFYLERSILELKDVHEACVSTEILLSYETIARFAKECELVDTFYNPKRGRFTSKKVSDALNHWLFEYVNDVKYVDAPVLEISVQNTENEKIIKESKDENKKVDNDIYARDELTLDEDGEYFWNDRFRTRRLISFSLSDAENEMNTLMQKYHDTEHQAQVAQQNLTEPNILHTDEVYNRMLLDLENEIKNLFLKIKVFKDMMMYQSRAPRINLTDIKDLSTIPRVERWSYYFKWANIAKTHLKKKVKKIEVEVKSASEAYEEARMIADRSLLIESRVIGMTTSAAARLRKLLVEVAPPLVVVEEAAEVLEAHIVTSLTKSCQHLILIGDHQQLRPSAAYLRLARQYQLDVSLFERMIRNGVHSRRLGVQHRMRPEIAALVAPHIYPDLRNHRSVEDFPPVRGVAHNLFFFSHNYMEEQSEDDNSSRTNILEADLTLRLANYLMQQGYKPDEVTIVAAYSGQMFYMRRQRSLYNHLADVKITVLDNYQGEESRIILLSLVRNNDNDRIGFLGTENRICVALSRAKEGFFIFGNIELLKRNSTLWTNIAQTLANNGSLGSVLKLKCENHDGQITAITSLEDFVKVPEGGCLLDCKFNIPSCGHPCPRMCHAYDLQHADIRCKRDCERKICEIEGHSCPLNCGTKCKPCERFVEKALPCGHTRALQCHLAPDDPKVYCAEDVTVTLPGCGHKAVKPCSMKISDVHCGEKCESGRLSCGHACVLKCHVNDDPEHEKYICGKPCPRAKTGCAANLEDDLGDHKCPLTCAEACPPCDVQVNKKRSGCKHKKNVACHEDVNAEPCREKCARSLPCGHHCKKPCSEKCGDCMQKVKKTIPECHHEIEIACGTEPMREHCREKCERIMECGHSCASRCDQPCNQALCTEITKHSSEAPCGHSVRLPCNVYQASQRGSVPEATLLSLCEAPCGALLRCGHSCGGSCAGCRQGRLHQPCAARCHQLNICGHRCEEPCNQVCPPCRRRCEVRCPHSGCGKPCGAPCTPCTEAECKRACPHSKCSRACGAPCSRAPCDHACPRALACGHACRGLCGEPCPPVCKRCDPGNFPTDLLGDPYADDDKLIQLQDCPHILDVGTLDTLMKSENETIQIKTCPFCRTPIINTYRYKDLVNKMLKNEINPIKQKVYGTEQQRSKMRVEFVNKIKKIFETHKQYAENNYWNRAYNALRFILRGNFKSLSILHLDMYDIYLDLLITVGEYYIEYTAKKCTELDNEMKEQVKLICETLVASKQKISQQQQADISQELKRMNSIVQLSKLLGLSKHSPNPEVLEAANAATETVLTWRVFDEEKAVECLKKLEKAVKLSGIASKMERAMVVRAIGLKAGHWYKCPNGHLYCIGECGGAMQLSRCPECGATIGGERHTLAAGNQHAGEMDGSQFAAWSEEANNMANFQLD